jgi:hypothetical protein
MTGFDAQLWARLAIGFSRISIRRAGGYIRPHFLSTVCERFAPSRHGLVIRQNGVPVSVSRVRQDGIFERADGNCSSGDWHLFRLGLNQGGELS